MSIPENRGTPDPFQEIKKISEGAADKLRNEYTEDELLNLTEKEIEILFPGIRRYKKRRKILSVINQCKRAETSEASVSGQRGIYKFEKSVKVKVLVAGETFCTEDTFMKKLKLKKVDPQKSSRIIILFCPVVSRIGTDMEAAMARVTENKPVILVFMHHCHNPSHMINVTVEAAGDKIVKTVHCAFLETKGLLDCKENKQAIEAVRSELIKYKKK